MRIKRKSKVGKVSPTKVAEPPKLARRSLNRKSGFKSGRTIGEKREKLETANERALARAKDKKKARRRVWWTACGFLFVILVLVATGFYLFGGWGSDEGASGGISSGASGGSGSSGASRGSGSSGASGGSGASGSSGGASGASSDGASVSSGTSSSGVSSGAEFSPSVEVYDEGTNQSAVLTARMREYIGQAEADFAELGYQVTRVVLPSNSVREMDFYLENVPGYLKLILDRGTGVSVEDADRMLKYLAREGVDEFSYIDVRLDGRAYWK